MEYKDFQALVFAEAEKAGLTEYELYFESSDSTKLDVYKDEVKGFSSAIDAACGIRVVYAGHIGYASTSLMNEEEAARLVAHAIENAECMEKEEPLFFAEGGQTYAEVEPTTVTEISGNEMAEIAKALLKKEHEKDARVSDNSEVSVMIDRSVTRIDNSHGVHLSHAVNMGAVIGSCIITDGDETSDAFQLKVGDPASLDLDEVAEKVVEKAANGLGAGVPASGKMPVVFSTDAMGSMLSVFSAAFSGENALNGLSSMKDKEETMVAAPIVTLMDDPLYEKSIHRMPFDDEGTPTYTKAIIENGVLKTLLYDMATAARCGKKTTGNARRSVSSPVSVAPSVMYIQPGKDKVEDLYAACGNGILISRVGGLHAGANFITGDFSLQSSGFLIENGKKTSPIKSFTVAGNFYDMLKHITMIADDMEMGYSRISAPSVLVDELTVSGK